MRPKDEQAPSAHQLTSSWEQRSTSASDSEPGGKLLSQSLPTQNPETMEGTCEGSEAHGRWLDYQSDLDARYFDEAPNWYSVCRDDARQLDSEELRNHRAEWESAQQQLQEEHQKQKHRRDAIAIHDSDEERDLQTKRDMDDQKQRKKQKLQMENDAFVEQSRRQNLEKL